MDHTVHPPSEPLEHSTESPFRFAGKLPTTSDTLKKRKKKHCWGKLTFECYDNLKKITYGITILFTYVEKSQNW